MKKLNEPKIWVRLLQLLLRLSTDVWQASGLKFPPRQPRDQLSAYYSVLWIKIQHYNKLIYPRNILDISPLNSWSNICSEVLPRLVLARRFPKVCMKQLLTQRQFKNRRPVAEPGPSSRGVRGLSPGNLWITNREFLCNYYSFTVSKTRLRIQI